MSHSAALKAWAAWIVGVVVMVGLVATAWNTTPKTSPKFTGGAVHVDTGYRQSSTERSRAIEICDATNQDDCGEGVAVSSAVLESDLARLTSDTNECPATSGTQFPAAQVTPTASAMGLDRILLNLKVDPDDGENVAPGTYCGTVVVTRANAEGATVGTEEISISVSV